MLHALKRGKPKGLADLEDDKARAQELLHITESHRFNFSFPFMSIIDLSSIHFPRRLAIL